MQMNRRSFLRVTALADVAAHREAARVGAVEAGSLEVTVFIPPRPWRNKSVCASYWPRVESP